MLGTTSDPDHGSRLRAADVVPVAARGMTLRPTRSILSGIGIAIGIATLVAVLGISRSSQSELVAEIDALGTNLLTVSPGSALSGQNGSLPPSAAAMIDRVGPVLGSAGVYDVSASVYRTDRVPAANTDAISVYSADTGLLRTLQGQMARGRFLTPATAGYPVVVLGADAAAALGIDQAGGRQLVWLGNRWFAVAGIMAPLALAPELDRAALVGNGIARQVLAGSRAPAEIYVRTSPASVPAVAAVLPATADPQAPQAVSVVNPADALTARAEAATAFQGLFLALGAVALLVGGIGIGNVMIISVLERRSEIGLRRALGASRRHVAIQFAAESVLLAGAGGAAGAVLGGFATAVFATTRHWHAVVPAGYLAAATGVALAVGAVAGVYPATRAARLSPSEALRLT